MFRAPQPELPADFSQFAGKHYSVWAAGGGGHQVQGRSATEEFYQAALAVATPEQPALLVAGGNFTGELPSTDSVSVVKSLPNQQLMTVLNQAALIVSGGGDMMGQAIVLSKNIVAVPVAGDQPDRVLACAAAGLIYPATLAKTDIVAQCHKAMQKPLQPEQQFEPGLQLVLKDIFRLLGRSEAFSEGQTA